MPATKIHCDFYEIFGPDWKSIDDTKAATIVKTVKNLELVGKEPNLCGFVGTASAENVIGGFFALQYEAELLHYDRKKRLDKRFDTPFERLFFVLFARSGKLVLQNRKFVDLPLSMPLATQRLKEALTEVLQKSKIGYVLNFYSPDVAIAPEVFRSEFRQSDSVARLSVESPDPSKIPNDFVYYNPELDRNAIIRESHQHDYPSFQKVDLEARADEDLKQTHLAKDLIEAGDPTLMTYKIKGEERSLRKTQPKKFEIYVDTSVETIDIENLKAIVHTLRVDVGLPVDMPTQIPDGAQPSLFSHPASDFDEEYEDEN